MQMAKLGGRKQTYPHSPGNISLKQPQTQKEGTVPGGSIKESLHFVLGAEGIYFAVSSKVR